MGEQENLPPEVNNESQEPFPPEPVKENGAWRSFWTGAGLLAVSGGMIFLLAGGAPVRLAGASRSMKLKWEQRAQQIESVEKEAQAQSAPAEDLSQDHGQTGGQTK